MHNDKTRIARCKFSRAPSTWARASVIGGRARAQSWRELELGYLRPLSWVDDRPRSGSRAPAAVTVGCVCLCFRDDYRDGSATIEVMFTRFSRGRRTSLRTGIPEGSRRFQMSMCTSQRYLNDIRRISWDFFNGMIVRHFENIATKT